MKNSYLTVMLTILMALSAPLAMSHGGGHPIRYIAPEGVDQGECAKPTKPCKTIAYAVNKSNKGDKIRMAAGDYQVKDMDLFYLLNDMVAISGGYSRIDNYRKKSDNNITTIIGLPAEYRELLAKKGFRLLADAKASNRENSQYIQLLDQYNKISSSFSKSENCVNGNAGNFPCNNISLQSQFSRAQMSSTPSSVNDIWGYRDLNNGREYAVVGLFNGTIVIDVTDPTAPTEVGTVSGVGSSWRDVKVYQHFDNATKKYKAYAYVTTEGNGGFQILDLTNAPNSISLANTVNAFQTAHNVYLGNIDYATGLALEGQEAYIYIAGSSNGNGSYRIFNLTNPTNPTLVTTPPTTGYVHDATSMTITDSRTSQCSNGHNPCELFIDFNEKTVDIWDTTNKSSPVKISETTYPNASYTHSGWYSHDKKYIFIQDETDEQSKGVNTTLYVMDISDLTSPSIAGSYVGPTRAIDHNGFTLGDKYYMSNYKRGLTVLDVSNPISPQEIGFFDSYPIPEANDANFDGAWGTYPYLPSGNILISDITNGLFIVKDSTGTRSTDVGTIGLLYDSATYDETNATISVGVGRFAGSKDAVSVDYNLQAQSAAAGEDYTNTSGTINWAAGESGVKYVDIQLLDDPAEEDVEIFNLNLTNPQGGATLTNSSFTVSIKASDGAQNGQINLGTTSSSVNEANTTVSINVARINGSDGEISIDFATQDGSAIAGSDYTATSGTLTWADGDAADKTINVSILDDSAQESSENFTVVLTNPTGGSNLNNSTYTVTINTSDQPTTTPEPDNGGGGGGPIMPLTIVGLLGLLYFRRVK